jgi:hypothetical protein
MNKRLVRIYGRAHLHFITFSCYRRLPFLRTPRARNLFVQILGEVAGTLPVFSGRLCGDA